MTGRTAETEPRLSPARPRPYQARWWALRLIRGYQMLLSPVLGKNCRFLPTCSKYGYEAVERYGVLKGGWLAIRRVGRCHPWGGHGYDPVPQPREP